MEGNREEGNQNFCYLILKPIEFVTLKQGEPINETNETKKQILDTNTNLKSEIKNDSLARKKEPVK